MESQQRIGLGLMILGIMMGIIVPNCIQHPIIALLFILEAVGFVFLVSSADNSDED